MATRLGSTALALVEEAEANSRCAYPTTSAQAHALTRAVRTGTLISPASGVYVRSEYWNNLTPYERTRHLLLALSRLHPTWTFAGPSAGVIHGLWVANAQLDKVTLATSKTAHTRSSSFRHIVVGGDEPVIRDGVRVTSFLRTTFDCMRLSAFGQALAVADSAVRVKGIEASRLVTNLGSACARRPGIQRALDIASLADGRSESGGESLARAAMIHLGLELPKLQVEVEDFLEAGKKYRVDFAWDLSDGPVLYGELDGREKYENPKMTGGKDLTDMLLAERRREARVTVGEKPVKVVRFSVAEVMDVEEFG